MIKIQAQDAVKFVEVLLAKLIVSATMLPQFISAPFPPVKVILRSLGKTLPLLSKFRFTLRVVKEAGSVPPYK